jgi:leucyl aminopeptidase (aminopeptidase T)
VYYESSIYIKVSLKKLTEVKMSDLKKAAQNVVNSCMGIKKGESVLIIIDESTRNIGKALLEESKSAEAEVMVVEMLPRKVNGEEPPNPITQAMKASDVVIAPTLKSISHTKARRDANKSGARIATMPGISEDMFMRTLSGDYNEIKERSLKLTKKLEHVKNIRLTTVLGTDVTMNFQGRTFEPDSGIIQESGDFGNLPGGEVCTGPMEGTTNGIVIVDGVMSGVGIIKQSIKITIENGCSC